jgi:NAD dependent epimerase/dehydratase family enzyme
MLPGDMARENFLASQNCVPQQLLESNFRFAYPELQGALENLLAKA